MSSPTCMGRRIAQMKVSQNRNSPSSGETMIHTNTEAVVCSSSAKKSLPLKGCAGFRLR